MKIPRDISATELIKLVKPFGYIVTRQTGSHKVNYANAKRTSYYNS